MSTSFTPLASRTSLVATPSATWQVGISPAFPSSLTLSNDTAIESLLTDIPFLSVGLLGFGVITFFFAMRKFNQLSFYVFASVIVAFVAGVLDVGHVLARDETSANNRNVSTASPLLIARELALAVSIGIRFFFFWNFVSRAPRGERLQIHTSHQQRPNFLRMDADVHGGRGARWATAGALFKYTLLLAIIAIPVLQLIWRFVAKSSRVGPVYIADGALQIAVSALFILKMFANAWLSPLTPRWKTIRDYSPVIVALLLGVGVAVGNVSCFRFSETSLGRLFQAVELYILVLYVLIAAFYHQDPLLATPQNIPDMDPTPPEVKPRETLSTFPITPLNVSMPESAERVTVPRRGFTIKKLASLLTNRKVSGGRNREQPRLWRKNDIEARMSTVDEKTGDAAWLDASPTEPRETTMSVAPFASVRHERITTTKEAPPGFRGNDVFPNGTLPSFNVEVYGTDNTVPPLRRTHPQGSPVYGLKGVVRHHDKMLPSPPESAESNVGPLVRQQAALDKSVAELQVFSSSSQQESTPTSSGMTPLPSGQPESFRSEFSLSKFPEPPVEVAVNLPKDAGATSLVNNTALTWKIPRKPVVVANATQQSSTTRENGESGVGEADGVRGTGGTQYDVTPFISDLTAPPSKGSISQNEKPRAHVEQPTLETGTAATVAKSAPRLGVRMQAPPSVLVAAEQAPPPGPLVGLRRIRQGLPPRSRLNISGPIPPLNVDKSTAYERPRPVPMP